MTNRPGMFILALLLAILAGCGFHLRGTAELPPVLESVHVKGDDRQMVQQLEQVLALSGATVVEGGAGAATLELLRSEFTREARTLDELGSATSYSLRYDVTYQVLDPAGKVLKRPTQIKQVRSLRFDANQLLQARDQERFLEKEMRREIVLQLMRQLETIPVGGAAPAGATPATGKPADPAPSG